MRARPGHLCASHSYALCLTFLHSHPPYSAHLSLPHPLLYRSRSCAWLALVLRPCPLVHYLCRVPLSALEAATLAYLLTLSTCETARAAEAPLGGEGGRGQPSPLATTLGYLQVGGNEGRGQEQCEVLLPGSCWG